MMPWLMEAPPEGDEWQHEIKYDGYRTELVIDGSRARAFTRNGHNWTDRYPGVVRSGEELFCASAIIDGEVIVQDELGNGFRPAAPQRTRPQAVTACGTSRFPARAAGSERAHLMHTIH